MYHSLDKCVMGWSSSKHCLTDPDGSNVNVFMDPAYYASHCIPHEETLEMVAPYTYIYLLYYIIVYYIAKIDIKPAFMGYICFCISISTRVVRAKIK